MTSNRAQTGVAGLLLFAGVALHGYENLLLSADPGVWFFLWSLLPYAVCLVDLVFAQSAIPIIAAATMALAIDAFTHYEVFVAPKGSTAALALLFVPFWSALVFVPATMLVVRYVARRRNAHAP